MFVESFDDATLIILIVSAFVSLGVGGYESYINKAQTLVEFIQPCLEGSAILAAVLLVAVITASQNHDKALKFQELQALGNQIMVTVVRGGKVKSIGTDDVVVGDIVVLNSGDMVPADGILIGGSDVTCDESSLSGEPDDVEKAELPQKRWLFSGSRLTSGNCKMLVLAVGANSEWGRIRASMQTESVNTPLQDKLEILANQIGWMGMIFAGATAIAMMADWYRGGVPGVTLFEQLLKAFIMAVTIVVVAVPEGLPLAVTLSLAYSTSKMMGDNNLIRVLSACETMGNATTICSDKTGTLTQNRMAVVECTLGTDQVKMDGSGHLNIPGSVLQNSTLMNHLSEGIANNSTAALSHEGAKAGPVVIGNKTEGALLLFLENDLKGDYNNARDKGFDGSRGDKLYTFTSARKCMSVLLCNNLNKGKPNEPVAVSYTKGAAEIVLAKCTKYINASGEVKMLETSVRREMENRISTMAKASLRTIILAHKTYYDRSKLPTRVQEGSRVMNSSSKSTRNSSKQSSVSDDLELHLVESDLVMDGLFGIKDPLRPEVPGAVAQCQAAGIMVRMVTGDNIETARAIARECGILTSDGIALEGPEFRKMSPAQVDEMLPRLQVLARSSPEDKYLLVSRLNGGQLPATREAWQKEHPRGDWNTQKDLLLPGYSEEWAASRPHGGDVVGVTGDGTNDGPALRAADVGLSMGLSGTEVAKAASDIIILDDNFSSIVKSVKWGRSVFDNIRKFLQFQLTVNVVALVVTFVSALTGRDPPLNAVMMLWVNLIMDTMGALALGTEVPSEALLNRLPYKRNASLLSNKMLRNISVQSILQIGLLIFLLVDGASTFGVAPDSDAHITIVFNTFVFSQIFNELNARYVFCGFPSLCLILPDDDNDEYTNPPSVTHRLCAFPVSLPSYVH